MDDLSFFQRVSEIIESNGVIIALLLPAGILVPVVRLIVNFIKERINAGPVARIDYVLERWTIRRIIDSKKAIKFLIKKYVQQALICLNNGVKLSTDKLVDEIYENITNNKGLFVILGRAGFGKSTIMRYLYNKSSKRRNKYCIYIPMILIDSKNKFELFLVDFTKKFKPKDGEQVTLFLDGLDESLLFSTEQMLLKAPFQETILEIKNICSNYFVCGCVVVSSRPEAFRKDLESLTDSWNGGENKVYELQKLEREEIIKLYNNLGIIKDFERNNIQDKNLWHFHEANPEKKDRRRYRKKLKLILNHSTKRDGELDSIFQIPLFIKYAYQYMTGIEKDSDNFYRTTHSPSFKTAFDIILDEAIFKWEYHVFHGDSAKKNNEFRKEFKEFVKIMRIFIRNVISNNKTNNINSFSIDLEQLRILGKSIIKNGGDSIRKEFRGNGAEKSIPDYIINSHCLFIANASGTSYEFPHRSFYEYFLAEYLSTRSSNTQQFSEMLTKRRSLLLDNEADKFLYPNTVSDLVNFYLGFLSEDATICKSISNYQDIFERKTADVDVSATNQLSLINLYTLLPWGQRFTYHGETFSGVYFDEIIKTHRVNLKHVKWMELAKIDGLIESDLIEQLELNGTIDFSDYSHITTMSNLKRLDIDNDDVNIGKWVIALNERNSRLEWVRVCAKSESNIDIVLNNLQSKMLNVETVYFRIESYSDFYIKIYKAYNLLKEAQDLAKIKVVILSESNAKKRYWDNSKHRVEDIELMESVFWLEQKSDSKKPTTIYDGLSLCQCYLCEDSIDEKKKAQKIYTALKLDNNDSDLHVQYLYRYGIYQVGKNNTEAEGLLKKAYPLVPNDQKNNCGCKLLKAYVFNEKIESLEVLDLLKDMGEHIKEDSGINTDYINFYYYDMVVELSKFRLLIRMCAEHNILDIQSKIDNAILSLHKKVSNHFTAAAKLNSAYQLFLSNYYTSLFMAALKFMATLRFKYISCADYDKLHDITNDFEVWYKCQIENEVDPRQKQAHFIMYKGSSMMNLFFSEDYDNAIQLANELSSYEYRKNNRVINACRFVIEQSEKGELALDSTSDYYDDFVYMVTEWKWI